MSQSYYTMMQSLWSSSGDIPGVTNEQLARFKQRFRSSVFMCRFFSCQSAFDSMKELEDHESSRHAGIIRCIKPSCSVGRIGFPSIKALKVHIRTHHNDNLINRRPTSIERKFECEGCSKHFGLERELTRHQESRRGTLCASPQSATSQTARVDVSEDSWIPTDWINIPSRFEDGLAVNDSWDSFDLD
jgi:hypothetical protein